MQVGRVQQLNWKSVYCRTLKLSHNAEIKIILILICFSQTINNCFLHINNRVLFEFFIDYIKKSVIKAIEKIKQLKIC